MKHLRTLMTMGSALALSVSGIVLAPAAQPIKTPPPVPSDYQPVRPAGVSPQAPNGVDNQRGIIKLRSCSASLIKFSNSQPGDRALMLTNGHCMFGGSRFPAQGEVVVDSQANLPGELLDENSKSVMNVRGEKILYGTMTDTDASLFQLDVTFQQIKDKTGIEALPLANRGPKVGDALTVNSGYWKEIYRCPMVKQIYQLKEGAYTWMDAVKYKDQCGTKPGTSGSPVMDDKTGEVVAINNTGNDNGQKCTDNNPCEVDEQGNVYYLKGTNYGTQTQWFYGCWNDSRKIDLTLPGCRLPQKNGKPNPTPTPKPTVTPTSTPTATSSPTKPAPAGGEIAVTNANVDEVIAKSQTQPVVFVVGANWSGFTQKLLPKMRQKLAADGNTWTLAYVDGALYKQALAKFNIESYPTVIAYSDGQELTDPARFADGTRSQEAVDSFVDAAVAAWKNQH